MNSKRDGGRVARNIEAVKGGVQTALQVVNASLRTESWGSVVITIDYLRGGVREVRVCNEDAGGGQKGGKRGVKGGW